MGVFNNDLIDVELDAQFLSIYEKPEAALFLFDVVSNLNINIKNSLIKPILERRNEYKRIPFEVRWNYWSSWALSDFPDKGLLFLKDTEWLQEFVELSVLVSLPQNPVTHPEGDVFTHTYMTVSKAASIAKRNNLLDEDRIILVFSALCHDIGKAEGGYGHEVSGERLSRSFLSSIGAPFDVIQKVSKLVRYHMIDYIEAGKLINISNINNVFVSNLAFNLLPSSLDILFMLHEADVTGRGNGKVFSDSTSANFKKIMSIYKGFNKKLFSHRDILALGAEGLLPKEIFEYGDHQEMLTERVNSLIEAGILDVSELKTILGYIFSDVYIEALEFVNSLEYRDFKKFLEYIEKSGTDLDTILLKGKSRIEQILTTPSN